MFLLIEFVRISKALVLVQAPVFQYVETDVDEGERVDEEEDKNGKVEPDKLVQAPKEETTPESRTTFSHNKLRVRYT